jgi:hypothetical protein
MALHPVTQIDNFVYKYTYISIYIYIHTCICSLHVGPLFQVLSKARKHFPVWITYDPVYAEVWKLLGVVKKFLEFSDINDLVHHQLALPG